MPDRAGWQAAQPAASPQPAQPAEEGYQAQLAAALEKKGAQLAADVLPVLKESFRLYQSLFANLYNILYRKSLIQEDPYQYDRKITEVTVPSREPFAESEKAEKLSQRLAEYQGQLEFLNTYYQFSLEFLSLDRLKRVAGLVRYLDWGNLITASADVNTSVLAEALGKVKLGADKISAGIVTDAAVQLATLSKQTLARLKEVVAWQRESFKLDLRRRLFAPLGAGLAKAVADGAEQAVPRLERAFRQHLSDRPFYRDLVREALDEDYSPESARLRAAALDRLALPAEKPAEQAPAVDYRAVLLEAIRLLIPLQSPLDDALAKLEANQEQTAGRRRGWRLRSLFGSARAGGASAVMEIRQFDSSTGVTRSSQVNFPEFATKVRRKSALLATLASAASSASARLRAAPEQELCDFLNQNLGELQLFFRIMAGLDAHFKGARGAGEVKGIRIELAEVKNCLVRANKKRYEYTARKEEERQKQELGLR
jgi:hypothetical protein